MPKIIPGIRDMIILTAHNQIMSGGYDAVSLLKIAEKCNIAVGTTYNYFNSKEELINAVIMADWNHTFDQVERENSPDIGVSIENDFMHMYDAIEKFFKIYTKGLAKRSRSKNARNFIDDKHEDFVADLTRRYKDTIRRYGYKESESFLKLVAEASISAAQEDIDDYEFEELIERILAVTKTRKRK